MLFFFCSPISSKKFRQRCQNCIPRVQRNRWWKCIFFKICFLFPAFRTLSKNILGLLLERLRTRSQNCGRCVQKEVLTKKFSKPCFFRSFYDFANFCWWSERNLSAGLSKLYFTCPGEHFMRSLFLMEKCYCFFLFSDFKQKNSTLLSKLNHRVQRKLPKTFWKTVTVSIFLWHSANSFRSFTEIFPAGLSKLFLCVQRIFLG